MSFTEEDHKRWEQERKYKEKHLSKKQWDALDSFRHGHGIGEYAYLSWPTANVLWRLGLIIIGSYWDPRRSRNEVVGYITKRGWEVLRRSGGWVSSTWHEPIKAYGWRPWTRSRAHVRASLKARLRAKKRGLYGSRSRAYGLMAKQVEWYCRNRNCRAWHKRVRSKDRPRCSECGRLLQRLPSSWV